MENNKIFKNVTNYITYWRRCFGGTLQDRIRNKNIKDKIYIDTSTINTVEPKRFR